MVVDLVETSCAAFAVFERSRLEGVLFRLWFFLLRRHGRIGFTDLAVDFCRCLLLHQVRDVGVMSSVVAEEI